MSDPKPLGPDELAACYALITRLMDDAPPRPSALTDFRMALETTEQRLRTRMNATMVERVLEIERRVEELEQKQR